MLLFKDLGVLLDPCGVSVCAIQHTHEHNIHPLVVQSDWSTVPLSTDFNCLISEHLSKCEGMQDELLVQLTDAETESEEEEEEEEDIVLKEKKRVKNAFLDDEAEVSDDDDGDDGGEDDEEDVAHDKPQRTDPREKSTFRERERDVPGDETSPAGEQGIHNDTFKGIIGTVFRT